MPSFDAREDTPATSVDAIDKFPFGDVSEDSWDTITAQKLAAAIVAVCDNLAALRMALGLGTASQADSDDFDAAGSAAAALASALAACQPVDADLTAIAALTTTSFGRALLALADAAEMRTAAALGTAATLDSDTDGTLAANSDANLPTQKAVKTYVDANGGSFDGTLEGTLIIRQPGGTPGTSEAWLYHDGTNLNIANQVASAHLKLGSIIEVHQGGGGAAGVATVICERFFGFGGTGVFKFKLCADDSAKVVVLASDMTLCWGSGTNLGGSLSGDIGIERSAAGVLKITDGSTGGGSVDLLEMSEPAAPSANTGRLFVQDNGSGKSQLCIRFASGASQVIATEP